MADVDLDDLFDEMEEEGIVTPPAASKAAPITPKNTHSSDLRSSPPNFQAMMGQSQASNGPPGLGNMMAQMMPMMQQMLAGGGPSAPFQMNPQTQANTNHAVLSEKDRWQQALEELPPNERDQWACTIEADMQKQNDGPYSLKKQGAFSHAYSAGQRGARTNKSKFVTERDRSSSTEAKHVPKQESPPDKDAGAYHLLQQQQYSPSILLQEVIETGIARLTNQRRKMNMPQSKKPAKLVDAVLESNLVDSSMIEQFLQGALSPSGTEIHPLVEAYREQCTRDMTHIDVNEFNLEPWRFPKLCAHLKQG